MKKILTGLLCVCLLSGLAGCGLFPEETQIDDTLKVAHYTPAQHQTVKVKRGDLDYSETMLLTYQSKEEIPYSFKSYTETDSWNSQIKCYVVEGDFVEKGQLLAEAPCEELETEIDSYQEQIASLQLDISYNEKLLKVSESKAEKQGYQAVLEDKGNQIEVLRLRIEEAEKKLQGYRIYADMDGQVTYILDYQFMGYEKSRTLLTVTALGGYFKGTISENACRMKEGDVVTAEIASKQQEITVERIENNGDGMLMVYFSAEGKYDESSRAKLMASGEKAENVLYIPATAVAVEDKNAYVKMVGEDGFPRAKEIKVSDLINGYYVVESGLEEGDEIINE